MIAGVLILAAAAPMVDAAGTISGNCWIEKVKGRPGDYLELYEWNVYISATNNAYPGQQFRVGLPPNPRGYYSFTVAGGMSSLFLDQPLFWGRPTVVPDVNVPSSGSINLNVQLPTDYSCAFGDNSGGWGSDPWTSWAQTWYQTFVATGTSITGVDFKLAGTHATRMQITIHRDTGGNVTTWPQGGVTRTKMNLGSGGDQWIRYRSGEVPTVPGQRYALKLTGTNGTPNNEYAIYRRIDNNDGYAQGQAYNSSGVGQNFDLYAIVFSDNDDTVIPYCARVHDGGNSGGWEWKWSQEIQAVGGGLAGAVIYFSSSTWDVPLNFRVHSGSVTGPQIGPTKTGRGAYQATNAGIAAVSWNPGEVPLTPGVKYYLEVSGTGEPNSLGLNPALFSQGDNAYPHGDAFRYETRQPGLDLHMQVVEYADADPPTIERTPSSFAHTIHRGESLVNDTLSIRNSGGGTLDYTVTDNATWLSVDPASGFSTGEWDNLDVIYNVGSLGIGSYSATITITGINATNTPQTVAVNLTVNPPLYAPADFDQDSDVDGADFGVLQACFTGPGIQITHPACLDADLDGDGDADQEDYEVFKGCLTGSNIPAEPLCAD